VIKSALFNFTIQNKMKTISQVLLLIITVSILAACGQQGVGPSKPTANKESAQ